MGATVDHGDHRHDSRADTECAAVAAEPEDAPLRPLAAALMRLLATPGRPTQAGGRLTMADLARGVEGIDARMRAGFGAALVARAWVDPDFKRRLIANAPAAAAELGIATSNYSAASGSGADISLYPATAEPARPNESGDLRGQIERFASGHTVLTVLENTPETHHVVVCTLCSCYPAAVLGLSPEWYKSRYYRARAVRDPRGLLRDEFGLDIAPSRRIRVADSTAEVRYLVLPLRPAGTEGWTEEQLRTIVTRDAMIGVAECRA